LPKIRIKKQNIAVVTGSSTGIGLKLQYFLQEMNFIHMLQCKIYARDFKSLFGKCKMI